MAIVTTRAVYCYCVQYVVQRVLRRTRQIRTRLSRKCRATVRLCVAWWLVLSMCTPTKQPSKTTTHCRCRTLGSTSSSPIRPFSRDSSATDHCMSACPALHFPLFLSLSLSLSLSVCVCVEIKRNVVEFLLTKSSLTAPFFECR